MSFTPETSETQTDFDSDDSGSSEIHFPTEEIVRMAGSTTQASFEHHVPTVPKIPIKVQQPSVPETRNLTECKTQQELLLEKQGFSRNLQIYRYNLYKKEKELKFKNSEISFSQFLNIEYLLREDCQWEIALRKGKQNRRYGNSLTWGLDELAETELKRLRRRIWYETAKWWRFRAYMLESSGLLARGFMSWRSNPNWYMHPVLIEDCKARGGCCSRNCGCCLNHERRISSAGPLGIGHCTLRCGCCKESHGFEVNPNLEKMMSDCFLSDGNINKTHEEVVYSNRLCLASIWGLGVDDGSNSDDYLKGTFVNLAPLPGRW